jgi:hypothetical protein
LQDTDFIYIYFNIFDFYSTIIISRSGSAGSFTQGAEDISYTTGAADISYTQGASDISYTHGAADISFPRSEDSGLNTTRNQMEQLISAPSPNHTEIVSFLQNNWEEFSKVCFIPVLKK